jgi:hypothetical protein
MSDLHEKAFVKCPYHLAQGYLEEDMRERAALPASRTITLRVPLGGGDLAKDVSVTVGPGVDPMHFDQPWKIHWTPKGGGPYPDFDGELTVRADENYTSAFLELRGTYRPPGGPLGAAFDHVAGAHIATATAKALLAELARNMEARYHRDEQAKQTSRPSGE